MRTIYVVHAMRYGNPEKHSYILLATHSGIRAMAAAEREEEERGGKYGCDVIKFSGKEGEIIRKAYNIG